MTKEDGIHHLEIFKRKVTCYDIYCCGLKFTRGKILTILEGKHDLNHQNVEKKPIVISFVIV